FATSWKIPAVLTKKRKAEAMKLPTLLARTAPFILMLLIVACGAHPQAADSTAPPAAATDAQAPVATNPVSEEPAQPAPQTEASPIPQPLVSTPAATEASAPENEPEPTAAIPGLI